MKILIAIIATLSISISLAAQSVNESLQKPCIPCEKVKSLQLPDVAIAQSTFSQEPVPHCKVSGTIGKEIGFEIALPEKWNYRFLMNGNGGFAGSIQTGHAKIIDGYASAATDTGHKGEGIKADWALNDLERQVNFGHLAVHRTTVISKEIVKQYYCAEISFSYFAGCSRGGGQALMEAQRYPKDFDGIVAGAPAFNWTQFAAEMIQNSQVVYPIQGATEDPVITASNLELLAASVLEQCDGLDGVSDAILNDPRDCNFDFDALPICPESAQSTECFTSKQLEAIKAIYAGVHDGQYKIYPGFPLGCENEEWGWRNWITGPSSTQFASGFPALQFGFGTETFKYLIFNDSTWDYSKYDFKDFANLTRSASANLDANATNYDAFRDRGGKMIIYHGWNDHALSALATIDHYEQVKGQDDRLDNYLRLFLLPGVLHCNGGPGPDQVDWLELVRDWVEKESAPERIVLSKMEEDQVTMTRPVFPYPKKAIYAGKGDPNKETSFTSLTE